MTSPPRMLDGNIVLNRIFLEHSDLFRACAHEAKSISAMMHPKPEPLVFDIARDLFGSIVRRYCEGDIYVRRDLGGNSGFSAYGSREDKGIDAP